MLEFKEISNKNLKRKFEIIITADVISTNFKDAIQKKIQSARYPGFRPGKAPLWIVKNDEKNLLEQGKLNDSLFYDVVLRQAYDYCAEIKKNQNLSIFNKEENITNIDIESYKDAIINGKDFTDIKFTFECELQPEIPDINFEEIEVNKKIFEVTEDDIKHYIEKLKGDLYIYKDADKDYQVKSNDKVICDLDGKIDNKEFDKGKADDLQVEVGKNEIVKEIEDSLISMKAGEEKFVDVVFPGDYPDRNIAGKKAKFHVKVKSIKESNKITTEDELLKHLNIKTKEELEKFITVAITKKCEEILRSDIKKQVEENLEQYDFELPESLLNAQKQLLEKNDLSLKDGELEIKVRKLAKNSLIFSRFATQKNIKITQSDVLQHIAGSVNLNELYADYMLDLYKKNKDFAYSVNVRIVENKILDELVKTVKQKEINSSVDEILKMKEVNEI
jgi:trigger factor